eukprot:COSAG04_NODE_476_length_13722_cov_16.614707_8_plen_97_part_00
MVRPRLLDADANRHDLSTYVSCQVRNAPLWVPEERQFRFLVLNCDPDAANNKQWFTSPDGIQVSQPPSLHTPPSPPSPPTPGRLDSGRGRKPSPGS